MPDPAGADPVAGTYLGFDFGLKRVGISTGNSYTRNTTPLDTVTNKSGTLNWDRVNALIEQWQPVGLVVGQPVQMDGSRQAITTEAENFARALGRRYALPVFLTDERLSSREASEIIKKNRAIGARKKTDRGITDRIAAAVLLSRWLEAQFP